MEVQSEDRDSAVYDREDDRSFGVENASTEVEDEVYVEVLVEVSRTSGEVISAQVLTGEIEGSGALRLRLGDRSGWALDEVERIGIY